MRGLLILVPAVLMAQISPPKPQAVKPKPASPSSTAGQVPACQIRHAKVEARRCSSTHHDDEKLPIRFGLSIFRSLAASLIYLLEKSRLSNGRLPMLQPVNAAVDASIWGTKN